MNNIIIGKEYIYGISELGFEGNIKYYNDTLYFLNKNKFISNDNNIYNTYISYLNRFISYLEKSQCKIYIYILEEEDFEILKESINKYIKKFMKKNNKSENIKRVMKNIEYKNNKEYIKEFICNNIKEYNINLSEMVLLDINRYKSVIYYLEEKENVIEVCKEEYKDLGHNDIYIETHKHFLKCFENYKYYYKTNYSIFDIVYLNS